MIERCLKVALVLVLAGGCGAGDEPGDLDVLTEDNNGNGYLDVVPPPRVSFDTPTNIKISLINSIEPGDLSGLALDYGVDPGLLDLATIRALFSFRLDYGGGITDELQESELLIPFEKAFEVACPQSVDLDVAVEVSAPLVGIVFEQDVIQTTVPVNQCGQTLRIEAFVNSQGDIDYTVEAIP